MLETIKKQRLFFIALIGIVVVSLTMTATFAYQTLQVEEQEGSNTGMTINVGTLDVTFTKTNKINFTNMPLLREYTSADYVEFVVDNANSTDDIAYQISLTDLEYSTNLSSEDFNYTIVEIKDNEEIVLNTGNFSELSEIEPYTTEFDLKLYDRTYNYIVKGEKQTIRLYLWLKETTGNQNNLENSLFKGIITLTSLFKGDIQPTLKQVILNNANNGDGILTTKYQSSPTTSPGTNLSLLEERNLLMSEDNYGTGWYFRGNVNDNYINYEGMCWRIVRIQGNGTIKLVLADENNLCNSETLSSTSSLIGGYTEEFLSTNLQSNLENWILGETIITDKTSLNYIPKNINESKNIVESNWCKEIKMVDFVEPTLQCTEEDMITSKVGILTVDEIMFAGSIKDGENYSHYLVANAESNYLTNTTSMLEDNILKVIFVNNIGEIEETAEEIYMGIRPSIVLSNETLYVSGDGTIENPYVIN